MTPRYLVLVALLSFISFQGRSQTDLQDPLGSAFRISAQAKLRALLPAKTCAIVFSGGLLAYDAAAQHPQKFDCDPDFYYLTGLRLPDAAVVVFAEPRNLTEGSVSTVLFLPDKTDYGLVSMGYEYRGKFGLQEGGVAIRQAGQWRKFIQEILSTEAVERVFTKPLQQLTYQKPGGTDYWDLNDKLFSALAPGFPFEPAAQKFYKEILAADTSTMATLSQRINAMLEYQSPALRDPILERFGRATRLEDLRALQAEIRRVKIDLLQYACCLSVLRVDKSEAEIALLTQSATVLVEAFKAAASRVQAGRAEARLQAVAEYVAQLRRATLPMRAVAASGKHAAQPNYNANAATLPKAGLVVLDVAVAVEGYVARATRTLPIGTLGSELRPLYDGVLDIHQKSIQGCLQNVAPSKLQATAAAGFDALDKTQIFSTNALGARKVLKVTDITPIGLSLVDGPLPKALKAGQVICLETAIYLPDEDGVTAKWRGTGIVLRDMVWIGPDGPQVLTKGIPSEVAALESLVQTPIRLPED
jgi:Xaa-Pro aminopeptidase